VLTKRMSKESLATMEAQEPGAPSSEGVEVNGETSSHGRMRYSGRREHKRSRSLYCQVLDDILSESLSTSALYSRSFDIVKLEAAQGWQVADLTSCCRFVGLFTNAPASSASSPVHLPQARHALC
jgi:hypothetical protein